MVRTKVDGCLSHIKVRRIENPIICEPINVTQSKVVSGLHSAGRCIGVPDSALIREDELNAEKVPIHRVHLALIKPRGRHDITILNWDRILPVSPGMEGGRIVGRAALPYER